MGGDLGENCSLLLHSSVAFNTAMRDWHQAQARKGGAAMPSPATPSMGPAQHHSHPLAWHRADAQLNNIRTAPRYLLAGCNHALSIESSSRRVLKHLEPALLFEGRPRVPWKCRTFRSVSIGARWRQLPVLRAQLPLSCDTLHSAGSCAHAQKCGRIHMRA